MRNLEEKMLEEVINAKYLVPIKLENNDLNNKENASSNEVETSDNLLKNIFIVLIVLSGGVILIYNFKKRKA